MQNWQIFYSLFCLTGKITQMILMWKRIMGLFLRKNHVWKCWGWLSLLNRIGSLILSLLLKQPPRKLETWFVLWSFFLLRLLCISINLPYGHVRNTVVMSRLVPLITTSKCLIIYKSRYVVSSGRSTWFLYHHF